MSGQVLAVGVPCEIKPGERRVGLTPKGTRSLTEAGIPVLVEKGAGEGSGYGDEEYEKAGSEIVSRARDLYKKAGIIKKVKEPFPPEWPFLREGMILFCYLHLASPENRKLVETLLVQKVIGLGLETVEKDGRTILLEPMSEIAGTLAGYLAGFFKQSVRLEKGRIVYPPRFSEKLQWLASQYPESPENLSPGRVVVYGGGTVGRKAAEAVLKMGAEVDLIEKREDRRRELSREFKIFSSRFRTCGPEDDIEGILKKSEVWLGCVHVPGKRAPLVMSPGDLQRLSKDTPKLILDIAVDQGGNFPETRSTTYEDPLYLDSVGNLRFGVTNVPSLCGSGASEAIEKVTLPYTIYLAQDWRKAVKEFPELRAGVQVVGGKLVNEGVASAHRLPWEGLNL